jgi:hypothetical protein
MGSVLDYRLVGYWSDETVYQGAMEVTDIAFRRDGTGWTYWSRDGGGFEVFRFSWHTAADHQLTIDLQELLSGIWDLAEHAVHHHVRSQTRWDKQIVVTYEVTPGQNVFREPATLLRLDRPISVATIGDQFAFKRQLAETDHDPTSRGP